LVAVDVDHFLMMLIKVDPAAEVEVVVCPHGCSKAAEVVDQVAAEDADLEVEEVVLTVAVEVAAINTAAVEEDQEAVEVAVATETATAVVISDTV
jgi:hypothetical protein